MPYYNNYLAHYGVKGMKWGVRRSRKKAVRTRRKNAQRADRDNWRSMSRSERRKNRDKANARYTKADRSSDQLFLGRGGVRRINRRMNKGQSHDQAFLREAGRTVAIGTMAYVGYGVVQTAIARPDLMRAAGRAINNAAKQTVINFVNSQAAKNAARRAAEQTFRLGNEVVKLKPWQYKVN